MRDSWCRRHARELLLGGLAMATGFCSVPSVFAAAPVVAGYSVLTTAKASDVDRGQPLLGGPIKPSESVGNEIVVEQGRQLYHTLGCVACHAPEKPPANETVPSVPI